MTKREFIEYARACQVWAFYSGKKKRFFLKKTGFKMNIHAIINNKSYEK